MSNIASIPNPEEFRIQVRKRVCPLLQGDDKLASNIEKGVYNWAIQAATKQNIVKKWSNPFFITLYIDRLRSVYINLKKPNIASAIIEEKITPQDFAFMTHQEICPEKWKQLIEDKKIRDKKKYEPNIEASTDNFTCNKCKSGVFHIEVVPVVGIIYGMPLHVELGIFALYSCNGVDICFNVGK